MFWLTIDALRACPLRHIRSGTGLSVECSQLRASSNSLSKHQSSAILCNSQSAFSGQWHLSRPGVAQWLVTFLIPHRVSPWVVVSLLFSVIHPRAYTHTHALVCKSTYWRCAIVKSCEGRMDETTSTLSWNPEMQVPILLIFDYENHHTIRIYITILNCHHKWIRLLGGLKWSSLNSGKSHQEFSESGRPITVRCLHSARWSSWWPPFLSNLSTHSASTLRSLVHRDWMVVSRRDLGRTPLFWFHCVHTSSLPLLFWWRHIAHWFFLFQAAHWWIYLS